MSTDDVIRAWKDPEYRAERTSFAPDHPAGRIELADPGLEQNPAELYSHGSILLGRACFPHFTHGCK